MTGRELFIERTGAKVSAKEFEKLMELCEGRGITLDELCTLWMALARIQRISRKIGVEF